MDEAGLEDLGLSDQLVIGEAVVLELRAASFATRALALLLDIGVVGAVGAGLGWLLVTTGGRLDAAGRRALVLVTFVVALVGVPAVVETLTRGRSLGKLAAGLRVVRDDGGPIRFRHALIRALFGFVEIYALSGSVALIASLSNRRGKRIGDMVAGTYVVRERTTGHLQPMAWMPPELAGWAAGADIGRIPDRLAMAARTFLGRAVMLNPRSRQQLGVSLAGQLAFFVAPPPPAGADPERFVCAVLAERRRRDLDRLQSEAAARQAREERRRRASPLSATGTSLVGEDR